MNIAVLGPGKMGSALALTWVGQGHRVVASMFRDEQKYSRLVSAGITLKKSITSAVSQADIVVISCPYHALGALYQHQELFRGKPVVTCVSAICPDFTGATIGLPVNLRISVAEEIQQNLPDAHVVEAFNMAFSANLMEERKDFQGMYGSIFYCGDEKSSKEMAASLIRDCGYEPINAGPLISARTLETLSSAWLQFAIASGLFPRVSIKLLKR